MKSKQILEQIEGDIAMLVALREWLAAHPEALEAGTGVFDHVHLMEPSLFCYAPENPTALARAIGGKWTRCGRDWKSEVVPGIPFKIMHAEPEPKNVETDLELC